MAKQIGLALTLGNENHSLLRMAASSSGRRYGTRRTPSMQPADGLTQPPRPSAGLCQNFFSGVRTERKSGAPLSSWYVHSKVARGSYAAALNSSLEEWFRARRVCAVAARRPAMPNAGFVDASYDRGHRAENWRAMVERGLRFT